MYHACSKIRATTRENLKIIKRHALLLCYYKFLILSRTKKDTLLKENQKQKINLPYEMDTK